MTKKIAGERCSEIIHDYLEQRCDEDTGKRMMDFFAKWYYNDTDREEKDRIIEELEMIEAKPGAISDEFVERILANISTRIGMTEKRETEPDNEIESLRPTVKLKRKAQTQIWSRVAAVLVPLILITGGVMLWMNSGRESDIFAVTLEVPYGETEQCTLGDNTEVTLNAGSTLVVSLNQKERLAELTGETFFSVAKDEKRPFVIRTSDIAITVLGTELNVEAYPENDHSTVVTLISGKVELQDALGTKWQLVPGEQFSYDSRTQQGEVIQLSCPTDAIAWRSGEMVCRMRRLPEILRMVERKLNIKVVMDEAVMQFETKYTCAFQNGDSPESVISALQVLTDTFDYTTKDGAIYVINSLKME